MSVRVIFLYFIFFSPTTSPSVPLILMSAFSALLCGFLLFLVVPYVTTFSREVFFSKKFPRSLKVASLSLFLIVFSTNEWCRFYKWRGDAAKIKVMRGKLNYVYSTESEKRAYLVEEFISRVFGLKKIFFNWFLTRLHCRNLLPNN